MNKATKAALLSALVFPGCGHLYLKHWVTGIVLSGIAAYAVYAIVSVVLRVTRDVARMIEIGALAADINTITQAVSQQVSGSEQATQFATTLFGVCWVIAVVHSWWLGRTQDQQKLQAHGREKIEESDTLD